MKLQLLVVCVLASVFCKVSSHKAKTIHLWRDPETALGTMKDWKIPQINVSENCVPQHLVQVKSDKFVEGEGLYKLEGPGVDQEPENLFEIDELNGTIWSKNPLDAENGQKFTLNISVVSPSGEILENATNIEVVVENIDNNTCKALRGPGKERNKFVIVITVTLSVLPLVLLLVLWAAIVETCDKRREPLERKVEEGQGGDDGSGGHAMTDEEAFRAWAAQSNCNLNQAPATPDNPCPMFTQNSTDSMGMEDLPFVLEHPCRSLEDLSDYGDFFYEDNEDEDSNAARFGSDLSCDGESLLDGTLSFMSSSGSEGDQNYEYLYD